MKIETRYYNTALTVRTATDEGGKKVLEGRAVPFNELSNDLGGFQERIAPGSFDLDHTIKSFWSHNPELVLGSTKSKTLKLEERADGIHFSLNLPNTTPGNDAFESTSRGDVDGMSFGMIVEDDRIDQVDGMIVRTVLAADLIEISPVAFPAFSQTNISVELRSRIDAFSDEDSQIVTASGHLVTASGHVEEDRDDETPSSIPMLERELDLLELE